MPRGFSGRGFGGGGFGMRRMGGGLGMGMGGGGYGSPLLTSLMAGGLGYVMGNNAAQQSQQPVAYPPYPYQQQTPAAPPPPTQNADNGKLAQLQLLGKLRDSGVLTNEEFERQKQQILGN
jgi:hypothetical protein